MTTPLVGIDLQNAHEKAAADALAAAARCNDLSVRKAGVQQEIERLQAAYDESCRQLADGDKTADPASVLADLDRRRHELRGLEGLITQAQAAHDPLAAKARGLAEQLLQSQENEQIDALLSKQFNLSRAAEDAEKKLKDARAEQFNAVNELTALRERIGRRRKQVA